MLEGLKSKQKGKASRDNLAGLPARQAAVQLLKAVLQDRQPLDFAIGRYGSRGPMQDLSQRDRAFARSIASTSLRRYGQIGQILDQLLDKPLPEKCGCLREILLAGSAQLLFLDSQPHAVINLAVHQCKIARQSRRFAKLVNAILRRVMNEGPDLIAVQDPWRLNTPEWMYGRWEKNYGEDAAKQIAAANLIEAPLDLTVKSGPMGWAERLGGFVLPTGTVRLVHKGRIDRIEGYEEGEWWVQDAAAALPIKLLGDIRGMRIADLCAAPGGKTAQLIHAGASVVAVDSSPVRLDRMRENLLRLNLTAEILEADFKTWKPREYFDAVLLDAPCSATGTIRRHPDILHLKQAEDIAELVVIQRDMIAHAIKLLKPGGVLVYCTCSLEPEEGIEQISHCLNSDPSLRFDPIGSTVVGGLVSMLNGGAVRTLPFHIETGDQASSGIDAFFAARIHKN